MSLSAFEPRILPRILFMNAIIWVLIDQKLKVTNVVIMFKSWIGFYDYRAMWENGKSSVRIAIFNKITANKSVKKQQFASYG
jgi:hypothetical protein